MRKILVFLILFLVVISVFSSVEQAEASIYHIRLEGEINIAQYSFINDALSRAEAEGAEEFIIEINSLGGFVDPALRIRDRIFDSPLRIITFVNGRAWSAAALIALTGDEIYLSSGSSIGAAETRPQEEKIISALRKEFAATAERTGRDGRIAEAMVDSDIEIESIIEREKLLTLTAREAVELGMGDFIAENLNELSELKAIDPGEIISIERSSLHNIVAIITNPYFSGLLLIIAFSALIFEALTPGFAVGGTLGIISLLIFFAGHILTGAIGTGMVILFIIGIILIFFEIFVIPGFGVAGISGITAVLISLFFVFPNRAIALNVLLGVVFFTLLIAFLMVKKMGTSRFWNKISLETSSKEYYSSSDKQDYVGRKALTITKLRPAGTIEIDNRRIDAVSEGGFIEKDSLVEVVSVSGSRIVVREIEEEAE
ncbi:ATP-dependent Clp protease proteolytic subunit [Halanaerobium sp. Z-7514]|uniref:ATP-dependent Clp protease proteolytic subunit n=1 Tax=Halanaerobium polyolivorans TaxID=2886943 RepID=A0AAW4X0R5_9FIRM|nr:NfeD family protein [Halanaerobium polyolivorans]MCC3145395.1 ATP-dependent Clp protease proteolytic subunit [Halanaerobium polyolivorans]